MIRQQARPDCLWYR